MIIITNIREELMINMRNTRMKEEVKKIRKGIVGKGAGVDQKMKGKKIVNIEGTGVQKKNEIKKISTKREEGQDQDMKILNLIVALASDILLMILLIV